MGRFLFPILRKLRRCHLCFEAILTNFNFPGIASGDKMLFHASYLQYAKRPQKSCYPAAERNKEPILDALKNYIEPTSTAFLLEVGSGSGQHVSHFADYFKTITFQPTEHDKNLLSSINAYAEDSSEKNILEAKRLDVRDKPSEWLGGSIGENAVDFVLSINMMHISEWGCTVGLFHGAAYILKAGGLMFTYGPYAINGTITPESNVKFDASLRSQSPSWGLRDVYKELAPLAESVGLHLKQVHDLPANNKFLVSEQAD